MSDEGRLHAAIRTAHRDGRIDIDVDLRAVNRNGSPSFRTTDIVVPWFCLGALSIYLGMAHHPLAGIGLFVVGAVLILLLLRPHTRRRAVERTIYMALAKVEHWQTLWQMGGLTLRRPDGASCVSPEGDWQGFAAMLKEGARGGELVR